MSGKNVRKMYTEFGYYHVYNRGRNREQIFCDDEDYRVFLNLFKRLLSKFVQKDSRGREYLNMHGSIDLNAYCLMPNHFHVLVYQRKSTAITELFRSLSTSYAMYFNKKYQHVGHVFQGDLRAAYIDNDEYFRYISCYIHLNPVDYQNWKYSSIGYFLASRHSDWIHPEVILESCGGSSAYAHNLELLASDKDIRNTAQEILTLGLSKDPGITPQSGSHPEKVA